MAKTGRTNRRTSLAQWTMGIAISLLALSVVAADISVVRLPSGGIQPQLFRTSDAVHVLYFQIEEEGSRMGNLVRSTYNPATQSFDKTTAISERPYRHNDQIGKADVAVDSSGGIHVAWLNADPLQYLYSRSLDGGETFEAPRSLVNENLEGVEVEPSVAAIGDRVAVSWHAGSMAAEHARRVYVVLSEDRGETFSEEIAVSQPGLGVCACCAMASAFNEEGEYLIAFRSAIDDTGRHMQVMAGGRAVNIGPWELNYCPVTSADTREGWLAFETDGRLMLWHARKMPQSTAITDEPAQVRQKHPSIAVNDSGDRLVVWGEGAGYFTGGSLNARKSGINESGQLLSNLGEIPEFSVASAVSVSDGSFLIVY